MEHTGQNEIHEEIPQDYPFKGTLDSMGIKVGEQIDAQPEGTDSTADSYKDIGQEKLNKATERVRGFGSSVSGFMSRQWGKVKSFGSATMEVGKTALVYTLAAPDMLRDANTKMQTGYIEGVENLRNKTSEGISFVADKADEYKERVKESGSKGIERVFDETVYVSDKAHEKYQNILNSGKEKYAKLQERAQSARVRLEDACAESRTRRAQRLVGSEAMRQAREYSTLVEKILGLQKQIEELRNAHQSENSEKNESIAA